MSYLIDTCCLSELVRKEPDEKVLSWFSQHDERTMYLSVLTMGEITKGIEKLPESKKRRELSRWLNDELTERFKGKILPVNTEIAQTWGSVLAESEKNGRPVPAVDALIAATAIVNDLFVVTRNTSDMAATGVNIIDPWSQTSIE